MLGKAFVSYGFSRIFEAAFLQFLSAYAESVSEAPLNLCGQQTLLLDVEPRALESINRARRPTNKTYIQQQPANRAKPNKISDRCHLVKSLMLPFDCLYFQHLIFPNNFDFNLSFLNHF